MTSKKKEEQDSPNLLNQVVIHLSDDPKDERGLKELGVAELIAGVDTGIAFNPDSLLTASLEESLARCVKRMKDRSVSSSIGRQAQEWVAKENPGWSSFSKWLDGYDRRTIENQTLLKKATVEGIESLFKKSRTEKIADLCPLVKTMKNWSSLPNPDSKMRRGKVTVTGPIFEQWMKRAGKKKVSKDGILSFEIEEAESNSAADIESLQKTVSNRAIVFTDYDPERKSDNWLDLLVDLWIRSKAEQKSDLPMVIRPAVSHSEADYDTLPRGFTISGLHSVEVNGEKYTVEPKEVSDLVLLQARSTEIVKQEWLAAPAQMELALDMKDYRIAEEDHLAASAITMTANSGDFPARVPKALLGMFACTPRTGNEHAGIVTRVEGTLQEFTELISPGYRNVKNKSHLQQTAAALYAIEKSLRVIERDENGAIQANRQMFMVESPFTADPDTKVGWILNPWLAEQMKGGTGGGHFLLNISKSLSLPDNNSRLLPLVVRLSAIFDSYKVKGVFKEERVNWMKLDILAFQAGSLPEGAAQYIRGTSKDVTNKKAATKARNKILDDLKKLEELEICRVKTRGRGKQTEVKVWPHNDYVEASKKYKAAMVKAAKKNKADRR